MPTKDRYRLSFLKTVSGSQDNPMLTEEFSKRIAEYSSMFTILDKAASFFYLFDFVQMRYLYCSESIKDIMGYTARDWIERGPDWVFSTILPDDVRRLKELHKALFAYYYSLPVAERKDYKYVWEVRAVRKDGRVIWIMQQGSFIEVDDHGKPMITFDILSDTSQIKRDNSMTLSMFKHVDDQEFKLFFPITSNEPFSKREIELINLISLGLNSREIAEKLFISPHTVDTHRRNMLRKAGVGDSMKLVSYGRDNGLI